MVKSCLRNNRKQLSLFFDQPSLTNQDRPKSDISSIVDRYRRFGELPVSRESCAVLQDYTSLGYDWSEICDLHIAMSEAFYELPLSVRTEFGNNPDVFYSEVTEERIKELLSSSLNHHKKEDFIKKMPSEVTNTFTEGSVFSDDERDDKTTRTGVQKTDQMPDGPDIVKNGAD